MSTENNLAVARRVYDDLFNEGNFDAADEIYASDYTSHDPQAPGINGAAAVKQYIGMYRAAFPDLHISIDDAIAEGDRVVMRWTSRGTHQGELMGIPPTGKQTSVTGINIFRLKDGRIHEEWINWDTLSLLQQLGVAPKMG